MDKLERVARGIHAAFYSMNSPKLAFEDQATLWLTQARAAIEAMREGLPDFSDTPLIEMLARECESAGTSDGVWNKLKALAEWVDTFDAAPASAEWSDAVEDSGQIAVR